MSKLFIILFLGFIAFSYAFESNVSPFNGSINLGVLEPKKWNQTTLSLSQGLTNVPFSKMWIYFTETKTGKLIPSSFFTKASITLSTSYENLSVYNALTSSINVERDFPATNEFVIPTGSLSLHVSCELAPSSPATEISVAWIFTKGTTGKTDVNRASIFVPSWTKQGETTEKETATLPYDGLLVWAVGNIMQGGVSVTLLNNATNKVICTSTVSKTTGQMSACLPNLQIAKGTKLTVEVVSDNTGVPNNGGIDLYIVKLAPTTTTHSTTSHSTTSHSTASHSTSGNSGHSGNNNGGSNGGNSGGHTGGNSGGDNGVTMGYSSGTAGSSDGFGTGGYISQQSIFASKKVRINEDWETDIVLQEEKQAKKF